MEGLKSENLGRERVEKHARLITVVIVQALTSMFCDDDRGLCSHVQVPREGLLTTYVEPKHMQKPRMQVSSTSMIDIECRSCKFVPDKRL